MFCTEVVLSLYFAQMLSCAFSSSSEVVALFCMFNLETSVSVCFVQKWFCFCILHRY